MADDKVKSLLDRFDDAKDRAARKAAGAAAKRTIGKLADGLLDELEELLLGDKGAAEEILKREQGVDPLERIREAYGLEGEGEVGSGKREEQDEERLTPAQERKARALAELARLKKVRAAMEGDVAPAAETAGGSAPEDKPATRPTRATRRL